MLCEGDVAVLAAGHCGGKLQNVQLSEMEITADHSWNGKTLAALRLPQEELVVLGAPGQGIADSPGRHGNSWPPMCW